MKELSRKVFPNLGSNIEVKGQRLAAEYTCFDWQFPSQSPFSLTRWWVIIASLTDATVMTRALQPWTGLFTGCHAQTDRQTAPYYKVSENRRTYRGQWEIPEEMWNCWGPLCPQRRQLVKSMQVQSASREEEQRRSACCTLTPFYHFYGFTYIYMHMQIGRESCTWCKLLVIKWSQGFSK